MKKHLLLLALALPLAHGYPFVSCGTKAQAAPAENSISNGGFESGKAGWAASGGTFLVTGTDANVAVGRFAGSWDASADAQTLSNSTAVPEGLKGQNCLVQMRYKGGDANLKFQAYDGSNVITEVALSAQTNYSAPVQLNFPCPTSGSIDARLIASADAAQVYVDDFYFGPATNITSTSQAELVGTVVMSNCSTLFGQGSAGWADFSAPTGCVYTITGNGISAPSTIQAGFKLSGGPGKYVITYDGYIGNNSGSSGFCRFRMTDGTNFSLEDVTPGYAPTAYAVGGTANFTFLKNGSFTDLPFRVQANSDGTGSCSIKGDGTQKGTFKIFRYPTDSEKILTLSQASWMIDANIVGGNSSFSGTSTYTEITNGSWTLTPRSHSAPVEIACSSTNPSSGTTCAAGSESFGVAFTPPTPGEYEVCGDFTFYNSNGGVNYYSHVTTQWVETNNNDQTILQEGGERTTSGTARIGSADHSTDVEIPVKRCGTFTFQNTAKKTLRLMYEAQNNSAVGVLYADGSTSNGQRDIKITVRRLSTINGVVKLANQVTTGNFNGVRLETVSVESQCTSSPCTITKKSSDWVSSINRTGTGSYTVNFNSGVFSSAPICMVTAFYSAGLGTNSLATISSSSVSFYTYNTEPSNMFAFDKPFAVMCMGPK